MDYPTLLLNTSLIKINTWLNNKGLLQYNVKTQLVLIYRSKF